MALKKLCRCGKTIDYSKKYCDECEKKYQQEQREKNRYYDKYIRDKESVSFYNSSEWIKIRKYMLSKYNGLDLYSLYIDKEIVYADTVHHIIELKDDWSRGLDITNLFPLSGSSHSKIHKMYEKDKEGTQRLLFNLLKRWREEYE